MSDELEASIRDVEERCGESVAAEAELSKNRERGLRRISQPRNIPVVGSVIACALVVLAVQELPKAKAVQTYGPNVAAMFLGVAFTVGAVQWFLELEQRRLDAPAERAAIAAVREVMFPLRHMISWTIRALAPDDPDLLKSSIVEMASTWRSLLVGADLTGDCPLLCV